MKAFSLVELSIVLVILGLLTSGILTGQNLIRAAELRSLSTQAATYHTAVMTFRDKYFAMPGDMRNAESFWGTDSDGCPTHAIWQTGKAETCNGTGNGTIDTAPERFRFWQHLANAGLIEGSYSGVTGPTNAGSCVSTDHQLGINAPRLKISNSGLGVVTSPSRTPGQVDFEFAGSYGTYFFLGGAINGCPPANPFLKPEEAWNVDTKLDDGKPGTGKLMTRTSCVGAGCYPNCNTATTSAGASTASTAEYLLTHTGTTCAFYYIFN